MADLTREEARKAYGDAGMLARRHDVLTHETLTNLRNAINRRMLDAALMEGTLHMEHPSQIEVFPGGGALRCRSYYFENREAVTFNPDGFVGFAGWADDKSIQPILAGFMDWLETLH